MAKATRERWSGDVKDLASVLGAGLKLPTDFVYGETFEKQLIQGEPIKTTVKGLRTLHSRLNFKKKDLQEGYVLAYKGKPDWPQTEEACNDFQGVMVPRLQLVLDHVRGALNRPNPAEWVLKLLGETEEQAPTDAPDEKAEETATEEPTLKLEEAATEETATEEVEKAKLDQTKPFPDVGWYVGWSAKKRMAWRAPWNNPNVKEYTKDLRPGSSGLRPAIARFKDGAESPVQGLLTETLNSMKTATAEEQNKRSSAIYFRIEGKDGEPIVVKRRRDGATGDGEPHMVTSLYVQNRQKCAVPQNDVVDEDTGKDIMIKLAENLAKGTFSVEQLYNERNNMLKEKGIELKTTKPGPRKRPAAAVAEPATETEAPAKTKPGPRKRPAAEPAEHDSIDGDARAEDSDDDDDNVEVKCIPPPPPAFFEF